jgi:hypothetical protein
LWNQCKCKYRTHEIPLHHAQLSQTYWATLHCRESRQHVHQTPCPHSRPVELHGRRKLPNPSPRAQSVANRSTPECAGEPAGPPPRPL